MNSVRHAGIVVSNLDNSLFFYTRLLGMKVARRMDESGDYIDAVTGLKAVNLTTVKLAADDGSLIELLFFHSHHGKVLQERNLFDKGISHIAFTVKDVEVQYDKLREEGVEFISLPQTSPDGYAKVAFCKDPDGNFVELVEVL